MDGVLFYVILSSSLLTILFIISLLRKRSASSEGEEETVAAAAAGRSERPAAAVRRVGGSRVARRSRLQPSQRQAEPSFNEDGEPQMDIDEEGEVEGISKAFDVGDAKIGAKKRKKLEMKAEKKAQREAEVSEREERLKRQQLLAEKRKQEEESEAAARAKELEEEKRLQKEKEQRELEEYLQLKATFEVESSGFEEQNNESETDLLKDFIQHIVEEKVVLLEDVALKFKLKTQDVIDRITRLLESKDLTGVIDDRGKFIYISKEELQAIVKFVNQRGRVTIAELAENSNSLIMMGRKESVKAS